MQAQLTDIQIAATNLERGGNLNEETAQKIWQEYAGYYTPVGVSPEIIEAILKHVLAATENESLAAA